MIQLRDYQQGSVDKVYESWKFNQNTLLVEPTGAGKTFIKGEFARYNSRENEPTIIFAHRDVLLSQISLSLAKMGVEHSFIAVNKTIKEITDLHLSELGESFYSPTSKIVVSSVPTFIRRHEKNLADISKKELWNKFLNSIELWMLDESHHCLENNQWGRCVKALPYALGLGVTATPLRGDGKGLGRGHGGVFDEMIVGSTYGELIRGGHLSPYKIFVPPQLLNVDGIKVTANGDFNQTQLAKRTDRVDITGDAVKQYIDFANGKQAITFCVNIAHAEHVAEEFNKAGIKSVALSSKTKISVRNHQLNEFKKGNIQNLVNCDLFGEGFDVPAVACVIMLRKTKSYSLFKQQFGRMLRVVDGKDYGILIDHVGNVKEHCIYGLPHEDPKWSLEAPIKKKGDDEKPEARICPECFNFYVPTVRSRFICRDCDHEETKLQTNEEMRKFIVDETDLVEMNNDFVDELLAKRKKVDMSPEKLRSNMTHGRMSSMVINSAVNNHTKRQFAQNQLRKEIQDYGVSKMKEEGWDLKTFQMFFEKQFKVNILNAQVLGERKSFELLEEIKNEKVCKM